MPDWNEFWPIIVAFGLLAAAGIGFPVPEELPTIGAGIWVASTPELGPLRWIILPVCFLGVLVSDILLYGIGWIWGSRLFEWHWVQRILPPEKREQIETNIHRYGIKILLLVRWVPAIRSPMFITAGVMRLPVDRFILADAVAAVFGHSLLFFLAYWFGDTFRTLVERAEHTVDTAVKPLVILSVIGLVTAYFVYHFYRRPISTLDPEEVPIIGETVAAKIQHPDESAEPAPGSGMPTRSSHSLSDPISSENGRAGPGPGSENQVVVGE